MNWRERIADWISGGKLTQVNDDLFAAGCERDEWHKLALSENVRRYQEGRKLCASLRDIAAMETPGANATVKRMAARAREALK